MAKSFIFMLIELQEDLKTHREEYQKEKFIDGQINPKGSKAIARRYFFAGKRFYEAMFQETKEEVYEELYEQMNNIHEGFFKEAEEFTHYSKV